jgi:hypothetical protein
MTTAKLIPLHDWAERTYGDAAPCIHTLRRWARDNRIAPAPQKHGRSYFVSPDARYSDPANPEPIADIQPPVRGNLLRRLLDGSKAA